MSWAVTNKTTNAHNTQYVYTVKNNKVASVSGSGANVTINALGKGATTITAKAVDGSGKTTSIKVTVQKMVTQIKLTYPSTAGIAAGKSMKFNATVAPSDANNKNLLWEVSNTNYFKVDSSGNVKMTKKVPASVPTQKTTLNVRPADNPAATRIYVADINNATYGYGSTAPASALVIQGYNDQVTGIGFGDSYNSKKTHKSVVLREDEYITYIDPYILYYSNKLDYYGYIDVMSSNSRVAEMYLYGSTWYLWPNSPGTTTITIKSMDGTNKSAKLKVTVKAVGETLY
jgi:uncharacterized protein YjdB